LTTHEAGNPFWSWGNDTAQKQKKKCDTRTPQAKVQITMRKKPEMQPKGAVRSQIQEINEREREKGLVTKPVGDHQLRWGGGDKTNFGVNPRREGKPSDGWGILLDRKGIKERDFGTCVKKKRKDARRL